MALATRCPYCNTTFRVTHDQLKLRGGLVRCGACKEIFNGVEHLLAAQTPTPPAAASSATPPSHAKPATGPEASPPSPAASDAPTDTTASIAPESTPHVTPASAKAAAPATGVEEKRSDLDGAQPESDSVPSADESAADEPTADQSTADQPAAAESAVSAASETPTPSRPESHTRAAWAATNTPLPPTTPEQDLDPLTRMTLMDMRPWPQSDTRLPSNTQTPADGRHSTRATDEIERALGELQDKPWRGSTHAAPQDDVDEIDALDNEEPDFVRQARVQARRQRRTRLILALGSVLLALLALMQTAIVMRTEIAARWPATLPALSWLCNLAGCRIGLPQQIEYVTIESHELQALPNSENGFLLSTLLRNRSRVAQAWPHLELTLNDPAEQPVARRVLTPADYLPAAERARGMAPSSERPLRITFTLAQLKASGYRLYVFYP